MIITAFVCLAAVAVLIMQLKNDVEDIMTGHSTLEHNATQLALAESWVKEKTISASLSLAPMLTTQHLRCVTL